MDTSRLLFPKSTPRALVRHRKRAETDAKLEQAYRDVDARDGGFCVVTGAYTVPKAADPRQRREHHHLSGRRVRPSWRHDAKRIITVRADVHQLLGSHALEVEGEDASQSLFFHWNRKIVGRGKEPFRLPSAGVITAGRKVKG